jgi:hypothetical protein
LEHVVMTEPELRRARADVRPAPLDHAFVRIDAQVAPRARSRSQELPREAPAAAAVVEDEVVHVARQRVEHLPGDRGIELAGVGRAD